MLDQKILSELNAYRKFKQNFEFCLTEIKEKDGMLYCDGMPLYTPTGAFIPECDKWLNVAYQIKHSMSKLLSNLYPYEFEFRGFRLQSIESFFQATKFKDPNIQQLVFSYKGTDAYHIQAASSYRWQDTGNLYWQGTPVNRYGADYELLVDEAYISAAQNPFYRQALKNVKKNIIHSIGQASKDESIFTREEFEKQINSLSAFIKQIDR